MKIPTPRQLPSGKWFVRIRVGDFDQSRTFNTEKEATEWATFTKADYKIHGSKLTPYAKWSTAELVEEYLNDKNLSDSTRKTYRNALDKFGVAVKMPFNSVKNWQYIIRKADVSPNTLQTYWKKLVAVWHYFGLSIPRVDLPKAKPKVKEYIEPDELPLFLEAIDGHRNEIYFLLMLSSLRINEALNITKDDLKKDGIHVRGTKTDSSDRFIPYLFPKIRGLELVETSERTLRRDLVKICEDLNFPILSPHSLRITFASIMYQNHVPDRIVMKMGGWSSLKTMHDIYIRISEKDVLDYGNIVSDFIANSLPKHCQNK